jgi:hypothetical protein
MTKNGLDQQQLMSVSLIYAQGWLPVCLGGLLVEFLAFDVVIWYFWPRTRRRRHNVTHTTIRNNKIRAIQYSSAALLTFVSLFYLYPFVLYVQSSVAALLQLGHDCCAGGPICTIVLAFLAKFWQ